MILAKKVRIKPTAEQEQKLWQSVGTARYVYNWALAKEKENYESGGKFISDNDLRKELTQLKKEELPWLKEVSNNVAKQAVKDACEAYKRFFKKQAKHPRFKSRKRSKPSFYNDTDKLKVKRLSVLIEKVGWVKTSEQIPMDTKYTNPRISHDGKYWHISVGIEIETASVELSDLTIGIDLGLKELAVISNETIYKNINKTRSVKQLEKRLRRLQRQASRKYEMNKEGKSFVKTCNISKLEKQIRLVHRRLTNIRNNHLHQVTTAIVKTKPSRIVLEDLNVKGMLKNKHLSKAVAQSKFHEFKRFLIYKCEMYGIELIVADRWFPSTQICSCCQNTKTGMEKLKLKDRVYKCHCGHVMDRDLNASINLSRYSA